MAKREQAPDYGTPQVPQGIIGSVPSPQSRMRGRSMLDTSPLHNALLNMQEESNEKLREQMKPILFQAGRQQELRRRAGAQADPDADPDAPDSPSLTSPSRKLFAIDAAYQAMYDAGRGHAFASHIAESHAKMLEERRKAPRRHSVPGRYGEMTPAESGIPEGAEGYYGDPDGFEEFSRQLEQSAYDQIAKVDPSGQALALTKDSISRIHSDQRERAEVEYSALLRLKGKEALDRSHSEHRRHVDHLVRNMIATRGPATTLAYVKSDEFRDYLEASRVELYETNPAVDVYYPGEGKRRGEEFNDATYNEAVSGIIADAVTHNRPDVLRGVADWLNRDGGNRYFDKEQHAARLQEATDGQRRSADEWRQRQLEVDERATRFGASGDTAQDRTGLSITHSKQMRDADEIAPGWRTWHSVPNQARNAHELKVAQHAATSSYLHEGMIYAIRVNEKGQTIDLDLRRIPGYKSIIARVQQFSDPESVVRELDNGVLIEDVLKISDLEPETKALLQERLARGERYVKPALLEGQDTAEKIRKNLGETAMHLERTPGDAYEASGGAAAGPRAAGASVDVDVRIAGHTADKPIEQTAEQIRSGEQDRTFVAGKTVEAWKGTPSTGMSTRTAKTIGGLLTTATAQPNGALASGVSNLDAAWHFGKAAIDGVSAGKTELAGAHTGIPAWADPDPFYMIASQQGVPERTVAALRLGLMFDGMGRGNYGKALFQGALEFKRLEPNLTAEQRENVNEWRETNADKIELLAGAFAGGVGDRRAAAAGVADALTGYALMQMRPGGSIDDALTEVMEIAAPHVLSVPMLETNGVEQPVVLHPLFKGQAQRTSLEAALPAVMSRSTLIGVFGEATYQSYLAQAAPIMTQIDGRFYIGFFKGGRPVQLPNSQEVWLDATELATLNARQGPLGTVQVSLPGASPHPDPQAGMATSTKTNDPRWRQFVHRRAYGSTAKPTPATH